MPHAVYLHSGLARDRHGHPEAGPPRTRLLRATRMDVGLAMLRRRRGQPGDAAGRGDQPAGHATTPTPSRARTPRCAARSDHTVALLFAIGLLASGLASTSVGAYAGAMIMQGLLRRVHTCCWCAGSSP